MEFIKPPRAPRAPKKIRGPSYFLTPRDERILKYIWTWKIASTASIHEAVNRTMSPYSTYKVLERLEANQFVECRFDFLGRFYVWQLTEKGFESIKLSLGDLKEDGFLSENHRHDRLVQAFQLGEWSTHQFPSVEFFTEQQMRRTAVDDYPDWVPHTAEHRSDGYTRITGQKKPWTLAYEVELTPKSPQKYEGVLRFYRYARIIDQVLWLVGDDQVKSQILRAKSCTQDDTFNYHVFVDKAEYEKSGWDSVITNERSENLGTLREKHRGILGDLSGEILGNLKGLTRVPVHLIGKKVIGKSRT